MKKALILGVNGQDGSYLAEFLLDREYQVIGWIPTSIPISFDNIQHILDRIIITKGDLLDQDSLNACIEEYHPDEVYNLAAPSFAPASWKAAVQVGDIVALGVVRLLEAIRCVYPQAHFFQASSSEMFGNPTETPQNETTPFHPRNPYGMAKLYAHWATVNYRQRYNLFAVSGIMFNHESPRRPVEFVTRKITQAAARIKAGLDNELQLGNIDGQRDWGFAGDYVEAMWMMLQKDQPDDFVIGTGKIHTVRNLLDQAFSYVNLDWHEYVKVDPTLLRKEESILRADISKAKRMLGWKPRVCFQELISIMVENDLKLVMGSD
ncbi:MAG: GDP-mannose 4,6-dehydratase [Lentisphaerae bacterium]|nr:GDP-mannose 4,6-dehydratase [Lentisphaerota bacterium]